MIISIFYKNEIDDLFFNLMLDLQIIIADINPNIMITDNTKQLIISLVFEKIIKKFIVKLNDIKKVNHFNNIIQTLFKNDLSNRLCFRLHRFSKDKDVEYELIFSRDDILQELRLYGLSGNIDYTAYVCLNIIIEYILYDILNYVISEIELTRDKIIDDKQLKYLLRMHIDYGFMI